jgi:hypothetical protein
MNRHILLIRPQTHYAAAAVSNKMKMHCDSFMGVKIKKIAARMQIYMGRERNSTT